MTKRIMQILEVLVDIWLVCVSMGVMIWLLLAPTYHTLFLRHWIDVVIGTVAFTLNFFLAVSGFKSILKKEEGTKVIVGLAVGSLVLWLLTGLIFFVGIGTSPFIYHLASYAWMWYLFVWFFYTRKSVKQLF